MTNAPHLLQLAPVGQKYGSIEMLDAMAYDGLTDAFDHIAMGASTERHNTKLGLGRAEQDEFAARSHQRAALAQKNGAFDEEIVPVQIPQRRGDPLDVTTDEGVRPTRRSRPWPSCDPPSTRTARSRPDRRRRSATVPARSSS